MWEKRPGPPRAFYIGLPTISGHPCMGACAGPSVPLAFRAGPIAFARNE